jgi:hypothetical protein
MKPEQPDNYEFNAAQEKVIASLARVMTLAATGFIVFGIVLIATAVLKARAIARLDIPINWSDFAYDASISAMNVVIGVIMLRVASFFRLVATTEGHDVAHLMDAVAALVKMKWVQFVLLSVASAYSAFYLFRLLSAM